MGAVITEIGTTIIIYKPVFKFYMKIFRNTRIPDGYPLVNTFKIQSERSALPDFVDPKW